MPTTYGPQNAVHRTGDETVAGVKTFADSPIVPEPTAAGHATSRAYVDACIARAIEEIAEEHDMARTAEYLESYDTKALPPSAPEGRVIATADGFMRRENGAWVTMPSPSAAAVYTAEQWGGLSNEERVEVLLEHAYVLVLVEDGGRGEGETVTILLPYAEGVVRVYGGRIVVKRDGGSELVTVEVGGHGGGGGLGESASHVYRKGVAGPGTVPLAPNDCVELVVEPSADQGMLGEITRWYQVS